MKLSDLESIHFPPAKNCNRFIRSSLLPLFLT
jgi:hypothetical protein